MDKILVLDFGGQYNQLIARRVREQKVFAEIKPYNKITVEEIRASGYSGIIFTGGPNSVYDEKAPRFSPEILELGVPILSICYGHQLVAYLAGGRVESANSISEYGKVTLRVKDSLLFKGIPAESVCWMSHTDYVSELPAGFSCIAVTDNCPCAAMSDPLRRIYAVQFHPEVTHTQFGKDMLRNFLYRICGCSGDWTMDKFTTGQIEKYREKLKGKKVLCALSGGVDSSVAAVLLNKGVHFADLPGLVLKNSDEFFADDLALFLRFFNAAEL